MAKNSWPTQSKGIFYPGYGKAKTPGPSAGERDTKKLSPSTHRPDTAESRMRKPARNKLTERSMRVPHG